VTETSPLLKRISSVRSSNHSIMVSPALNHITQVTS
jgi:hypothetical protein